MFAAVAMATSALVGTIATSRSDAWETMNPLSAAGFGLFVFGPMSVVLALAHASRVVLFGLSLLLAVWVAASWIVYASNDSSTSALIFMWAWVAGVPLTAMVGTLSRKMSTGAGTADD